MENTSRFDLTSELVGSELHVWEFIENAYCFRDSTPSHTFTSVVADAFDNNGYILVVARDMFDKDLAAAVIQFVRNNKDLIDTTKPLVILPGFHHSSYGFDAVCLINHEVQGLLEQYSINVHLRTVQAVPAHHSEFNKNDNVDVIKYVRSKFVSTLDWNRAVSPRVWLKFNNAITHSVGKKFGVTSKEIALQEILRIAEGKTGWAELKNYLDENIRLDYVDNSYLIVIKSTEQSINVPESEIAQWISSYLIDGLGSDK